ncbi:MAG: NAD(P)(+) transhydrogenase (Re/Si-specific) subunit beta [Sterolibacteriaceae bacterium]|uniref:proton-translocating NAD(P)(+) transhydrogenase n=1 Tax=Candidatus Methylophosphatis roskildensis TaxID=2899263 RepID=A0A9D7HMV5_9PROT|nr:NAD(P)(+) transhydrogenase (Re/Si-specific) subunit beta [Candidatus Methylophosphatis roskildensis]MBK7236196.1 NAD(P)(+) transhydrogenase (Re/Si-specific) subunit beta [Sterolibacteriaceae bacterium]
MPILKAYKARQLIANKRWMAPGYPGPDHGLCYVGKTMTGVGDAKKVIGEMCNAV